ncbi:hypothetical protein ACLEJQ_00680 [Pseudomonas sp. SMV71]|uniref:hypothetical protein n=1 Tax=unclassified Pseudomonas TaxID=196821 RepID=UPI003F837191
MKIITLTMRLPEGFQLPEDGRPEVSVRDARGIQISASGGQGSNVAPTEPVAANPWQHRFQIDPQAFDEGDELSVSAQIYQGATAVFLDTEHTFAWDGTDQHVDIPLSLAPASQAETAQAPAFGS